MRLLDFLVDTFINTFGITRPTPAGRRTASYFILALMILLLLGVFSVALLLRNSIR